MTNYRPMETARLIPSLANQSLVVLQNRKQEILDQLEKIAAVTSTTNQQRYSMWTLSSQGGGGGASTKTTSSCGYSRSGGGGGAGGGAGTSLEDDDFIPFGASICSKYGPISRLSRLAPRPSGSVQASASFGSSLISTPGGKRTPLISAGLDWMDTEESTTAAQRDAFYVESERMKYELEVLKQQIDELKMATHEATVVSEGRQRLAHELHLIEDNIREKERQLRLTTQRKRRNVSSNLPLNGKTTPTIDWDMQFFNSFDDEEDNGIASGMRELELRLQHELEDQE